MQRQQVQRGLQVVAVLGHRGFQRRFAVFGVVVAEVVGLVVKHPVASAMLEHQVGKPHQHALQLALRQRRTVEPGQQMGPAQPVQRATVQGLTGQPEFHFRQRVGDLGQRCADRRQRRLDDLHQPVHDRWPAVTPAQALATTQQLLLQCWRRDLVKALAGQPLELVVQEIARQRAARKAVPGRAGC